MEKKRDEFQQQVELYKNQLLRLHRKVHETKEEMTGTPEVNPPKRELSTSLKQSTKSSPNQAKSPSTTTKTPTEQKKAPQVHLPNQFMDLEMFKEEDADASPVHSSFSSTKPISSVKEGTVEDTSASPICLQDQLADYKLINFDLIAEPAEKKSDSTAAKSQDSKPPQEDQQDHYNTLRQADLDMHNQKNGYLQITVSAADMAIPLSGARCVISKITDEKKHVYHNVLTNENGKTEELALSTLDKHISGSSDDSSRPFALYNLEVTKDGYKQVCDFNLPVFDGILSVQNVTMIPLAGINDESEEPALDESHPR